MSNSVSILEHLESLKKAIDENKESDNWMLISPRGVAYIGKIEEITTVVIKNHPMMTLDITKGYRYEEG